jgi:uncharacterized membrane protein HdeD (DUF308 family)
MMEVHTERVSEVQTYRAQYLSLSTRSMRLFRNHIFMMIVRVTGIITGIIVLAKPQVGALIISGNFLKVAVLDLVMAIYVFSLSRLSSSNNLKAA